MGRQIRFYMGPGDEETFITYVRETGNVAIIPQTSRQRLKEQLQTLADAEHRELGKNCCLWNKAISREPQVNYIEKRDIYWIDPSQSELIEIMRSRLLPESELSMGRLWMETTFLTPSGELAPKSDQFVAWYASLCRWIKQASVRVFDGAYVLPDADALIKSGIEPIGHVS